MDNETIGKIIDGKGLNDAANDKIDDGDITPSDDSYYEYRWGKPQAEFTKSWQQHPSRASLFWAT